MNYKLSDALNEVRDEYIEAAANLRPRTGGKWVWATAAVLALVIAAGAVAHSWQTPGASLEQPGTEPAVTAPQPTVLPTEPTVQPTQPITPPAGGAKIYWARSASGYNPVAKKGEVVIGKNLERALELSTDPADYFAVSLEEATGVEKEVLYREIVLPMGAKEEFMGKGVVYLTRDQIEKLECPAGMSIVLKLHYKQDVEVKRQGECLVPEDYFDKLIVDTVDVIVSFPITDVYCDNWPSTESCSFDSIKMEFLKEYGIPVEAWVYKFHGHQHQALLRGVDAKAVSKMIHDPRIVEMWDMYLLDLPIPSEQEEVFWEHWENGNW